MPDCPAAESPYRVTYKGDFRIARAPSTPPASTPSKKQLQRALEADVATFDELQRRLYAADHHALLLVFQAMDAAGKDGTIRAVTRGVDPAGFQVSSFKQPNSEELEHDFLWRTTRRLPERGRVGVFNRSYYEEVLIVRVHPRYLERQRLPDGVTPGVLWRQRYASIREHERHLHANGTVVLKFWLNVSRQEQRLRFLDRLHVPEKNWKFSTADVHEREHWDAYMDAYEKALNETSRPWAPWYAIPADDKPYMRAVIADIIVRTLQNLDPRYPKVSTEKLAEFTEMRVFLEHDT